MPTIYNYLAIGEDQQLIVDWFDALDMEKSTNENDERIVHYFRALASEPMTELIDQEKTPLVFIEKPRLVRESLRTDSAVIFSPKNLKSQFPELQRVNLSFARWLKNFDQIFSKKPDRPNEWNYYLEAGIQNFDANLYALPNAMNALRNGQYFVHRNANRGQLDVLVQSLKLRGFEVAAA